MRASQLDWTILNPQRLTNGPPTGRVRKGTDLRVRMLSKLSRANLAVAILDGLDQPRFVYQAVFLKLAYICCVLLPVRSSQLSKWAGG